MPISASVIVLMSLHVRVYLVKPRLYGQDLLFSNFFKNQCKNIHSEQILVLVWTRPKTQLDVLKNVTNIHTTDKTTMDIKFITVLKTDQATGWQHRSGIIIKYLKDIIVVFENQLRLLFPSSS